MSPAAIPRVIHQTWKDAYPPVDLFRPRWIESWKRLHPGWRYRLWTDADNRSLIAAHFPWFLDTFDRYPLNIHRADAIRYFILYHCGGLYVDLDFECLRNVSPLLDGAGLVCGLMGADKSFADAIPNAFLASAAGHELWPPVFAALQEHAGAGRVEERTGPILVRKVLASRYPALFQPDVDGFDDVRLIGNGRVYPIDWRDGSAFSGSLDAAMMDDPATFFPDAFCVTYWTRSWNHEEPRRRRRRWLEHA